MLVKLNVGIGPRPAPFLISYHCSFVFIFVFPGRCTCVALSPGVADVLFVYKTSISIRHILTLFMSTWKVWQSKLEVSPEKIWKTLIEFNKDVLNRYIEIYCK